MIKNLYGITGNKQHGKDTLAEFIKNKNNIYRIVHFADDLKNMVSDIFNIPINYFNDPALKEQLMLFPIEMDAFVDDMSNKTKLNIEKKKLIARTPRQLMQFFGTNYVRSAQDSFWQDKFVENTSNNSHVIVADVRFITEANLIKSMGGKIIKVIRQKFSQTKDDHKSELEINDIKQDLKIYVKNNDLRLSEIVGDAIAYGGFEDAMYYDVANVKKAIHYNDFLKNYYGGMDLSTI